MRSRGKEPQLGVVEEGRAPKVCLLQCLHGNSTWTLWALSLTFRRPLIGNSAWEYIKLFFLHCGVHSPSMVLAQQFSFSQCSSLLNYTLYIRLTLSGSVLTTVTWCPLATSAFIIAWYTIWWLGDALGKMPKILAPSPLNSEHSMNTNRKHTHFLPISVQTTRHREIQNIV